MKQIHFVFLLVSLAAFSFFIRSAQSELKINPALLNSLNVIKIPFYKYCLGVCPQIQLVPTGPTTDCREFTVNCHCTGETDFSVNDVKIRSALGVRAFDFCIDNEYIRSQVSSGPDATRICHNGEDRPSTCTISSWSCNAGMECSTPDFPPPSP